MDTLEQIYARHSGQGKFNDKGTVHSYVPVYETLLAPYRATAQRVLEVGIFDGHSLRMWEEYFFNAEVHGIDLHDHPLDLVTLKPMMSEMSSPRADGTGYLRFTHNIHLFDATDIAEVERRFEGMSFDVIVEDASHVLRDSLAIYWNFKEHLAPGGLYVVEDIGKLDEDRHHFERLGAEIIDLRSVKCRFDDVLAVIRRGSA